jgi:Holliday junction resolvase RusA-like endonuclease
VIRQSCVCGGSAVEDAFLHAPGCGRGSVIAETVCSFFTEGTPIAQPRKVSWVKNGVHGTIEAKDHHPIHEWKARLRFNARAVAKAAAGKGVAVRLDLLFLMPRPDALQKPKHLDRVILHAKRPDTDNLIKAVKDALKRIAWEDDCQVSTVWARKRYTLPGESPGAHVHVIIDDPSEGVPFHP